MTAFMNQTEWIIHYQNYPSRFDGYRSNIFEFIYQFSHHNIDLLPSYKTDHEPIFDKDNFWNREP